MAGTVIPRMKPEKLPTLREKLMTLLEQYPAPSSIHPLVSAMTSANLVDGIDASSVSADPPEVSQYAPR